MKTRLLIIIGIAVIGAISISLLIYSDGMSEEVPVIPSNRYDNDTKTMIEIMDMSCAEILKENIKGLQYFTKEDGGEQIQEKIFECLKIENPTMDEIPLAKQPKIKITDAEITAIDTELEEIKNYNCDDMLKRNTQGVYLSGDNRDTARDRVDDCVRKQEYPIRFGACETILLMGQTPFKFYTDDGVSELVNKIHKCVVNGEFSLPDVLQTYQLGVCDVFDEPVCDYIKVTPQPIMEFISTDEFYELILDSERKVINAIPCEMLSDEYDGKMHMVWWDAHKEMISNAMNECKDNSSVIGN